MELRVAARPARLALAFTAVLFVCALGSASASAGGLKLLSQTARVDLPCANPANHTLVKWTHGRDRRRVR